MSLRPIKFSYQKIIKGTKQQKKKESEMRVSSKYYSDGLTLGHGTKRDQY